MIAFENPRTPWKISKGLISMGDWMAVSKNIRPCRKQADISVAIFGEGSRHIEFLKTLLIFDVLSKDIIL